MACRHVGGLCAKHKAWILHATALWQEEGSRWDAGLVLLLGTSWDECALAPVLRGMYILYVSTVNRMPLCEPTVLACGVIFLWGLFACSLGCVWWAVWMFLGAERCGGNHGAGMAFGLDVPCGSDPLHSSPNHTLSLSLSLALTHTHTQPKRAQLGPWFSTVGGRSQKTGILKE